MKTFGDRLREAASNADCDGDADAARAVGVELRTYGNYANGRVPKDPEVLIRMCRKFGTTPNILFGFETPDHQQEAAAIAEQLTAENRGLWFQFGRTLAQKRPPRRKNRRRVA